MERWRCPRPAMVGPLRPGRAGAQSRGTEALRGSRGGLQPPLGPIGPGSTRSAKPGCRVGAAGRPRAGPARARRPGWRASGPRWEVVGPRPRSQACGRRGDRRGDGGVTTARDRSQQAGMPSASPVTPTRPLRKRSRPRTGSGRWAANRRPWARLAGPGWAPQGPSRAPQGPSGAGALPTGGRWGEAGAGPTPTGLPVRLGAGPGSRAGPAGCRWTRLRRLRCGRGRRRSGWRSRGRSVGLAISRWRRRPHLDGAVRARVRWASCQPVRRVSDRRGRGADSPRLLAPSSRRRCDSPPGRRDLDPPHSVALPPTPRPAPLQSGWGRQDRW
jgi:hypothetical protein